MSPLQARFGLAVAVIAVSAVAVNAVFLQRGQPAWVVASEDLTVPEPVVISRSATTVRAQPVMPSSPDRVGRAATPSVVNAGIRQDHVDVDAGDALSLALARAGITRGTETQDTGAAQTAVHAPSQQPEGQNQSADALHQLIAEQAASPALQQDSMAALIAATAMEVDTTEVASGVRVPMPEPVDGATVIAVKRHLMEQGYLPGTINGEVDWQTRAAVFAFEFDHGLALRARPDTVAFRSIQQERRGGAGTVRDPERDAFSLEANDAEALIWRLQGQLLSVDSSGLAATGAFDVATQRAVSQFEARVGLPITGRPSGRFVVALDAFAGRERDDGRGWAESAHEAAQRRRANALVPTRDRQTALLP